MHPDHIHYFSTYIPQTFSTTSFPMLNQIKTFFGPKRKYVVVGATKNTSKFGYKILNWYLNHNLQVVPINPREEEILGQGVVSNLKQLLVALSEGKSISGHNLAIADGLSISFLTPPQITHQTLDEISSIANYKSLVKGLWFQPGSYDQAVLDKVTEIGLLERTVHEDECILVRGELGLYSSNL